MDWLVVWNMNVTFLYILGISSSQLAVIFFRGVGQPPTRMDWFRGKNTGNRAYFVGKYFAVYLPSGKLT